MNIYPIQAFKEGKDEILNLLSQLTKAPIYDDAKFNNIINNLNNTHKIFVYLKRQNSRHDNFIIRAKTYEAVLMAHIEDLVVDKDHRGMGIATNY